MASKLQEHKADEAGGESIFSSDGLPSLSLPAPPTAASKGPSSSETDDVVIEESINTLSVFENFIVKTDVDKGLWGILSKDGDQTEAPVIDVDDPRRKLFRLKREIDELESELAAAATTEDNHEFYTSMSNELRDRLERMGLKDDVALATMLRGRQEDLSRVIARNMDKFGPPAKAIDEEVAEGEKGKIVYELYKSDNCSTSSGGRLLGERLRYLEMAVGSSGEGVSLFERVEEAMKLAKEVDAKEVDKFAAKAKVIR
jgi:hypothetical protein